MKLAFEELFIGDFILTKTLYVISMVVMVLLVILLRKKVQHWLDAITQNGFVMFMQK